MTTRRTPVVTLALALALALGAVAGCTAGDGPDSTKTTPSTTSTTSTPSSTTTLSQAQQDLESAKDGVSNFWAVVDKLSIDPNASLDELATVSRSPSIGVWRQLLTEQRVAGQVQTGSSKVVSADAERAADGTFNATACIDVSTVNLVDKNGKSVVSANRAPRVKYTYVIAKGTDGHFYVTNDKAISAC